MPDLKPHQAPAILARIVDYCREDLGLFRGVEFPESVDTSEGATKKRWEELSRLMWLARAHFLRKKVDPVLPAGPVQVAEDLQVPKLIFQQVTDSEPLREFQEALDGAVQGLDEALAELAAGPGGEPS